MKLLISGETRIRDLNMEIAKTFPFLKLEFYRHRHKTGESSRLEQKMPDHTKLEEIIGIIKATLFEIQPSDTVANVEQRFQEEFGLPVQVCRKSGGLWVETTQTDNLTMERQNIIGSESSRPIQFNLHTLFL